MHRTALRLALVLLAVPLALPLPAQLAAQVTDGYELRPDGWVRHENGVTYPVDPTIVSVRFDASVMDVAAHLAALGASDSGLVGLEIVRSNRLGIHDLRLPADADPLAVAAALGAHPTTDFAEPTTHGFYVGVPNDPSFGTQWNLQNTGQTGGTSGADVSAVDAWDIQDGDPSVSVAVLDSGTEWSHPDLAANVWANVDEAVNGADSDSNGYIDDIRGWDFEFNDNDPSGPFFHGTFVAGCVAAVSSNATQLASLAGGASDGVGCKVMICGVGSFSPIGSILDDAIIYAADNGARVITLSLTVGSSAAINAAVDYAHDVQGVFIDCAAGNNGPSVSYPANLGKVMAVGSSDHNDAKSSFSNPGPQVEVVAPGDDVPSLDLGGGTTTSDGTSFAAPHVAALAALIFSQDPSVPNDAARQVIRTTADDIGPAGFDNGTGWGRINAHEALLALDGLVIGTLVAYGSGLAGFGGMEPQISTRGGVPNQGESSFGIIVSDARPNATAYALIGLAMDSVPFAGGTVLVDINLPSSLVQVSTTSASGSALRNLPIPDDPGIVGLVAHAQWVVDDPDGPQGFAFTDGLEMTVGS